MRSSSPTRSFIDPSDPYQPSIVEDLLKGQVEWRNIQDIIRVSFRALADTVKNQGIALREVERVLSSKVNAKDFHSVLSQKVDFTDFSENFAFLKSQVESKISHFEAESLISGHLADVSYALSAKASAEELAVLSQDKISSQEFVTTVDDMYSKLDFVHDEINRMLQSLASTRDLEELRNETSFKIQDIHSNIRSVEESQASLMSKKLNKADFDMAISRKNEELKSLHLAVEVKAEAEWTENTFKDIRKNMALEQENATRNEEDFKMFQQKNLENSENFLGIIKKIQDEIESNRESLLESLAKKAEIKDLEKAFNIIYKKADADSVHEQFSIQRKQTNESLHEKFTDVRGMIKKTEENIGEKLKTSEDYSKTLESQIKEAKNVLKQLESEHRSVAQETVSNFSKELEELRGEFKSEVAGVMKNLIELQRAKADRDEFKENFSKVSQKMTAKADLADFEKALQKSLKELLSNFQTIRDDYKITFTKLENQMSAKFDTLVTRSELRTSLSEKADTAQISRLISSKMNLEELVKLRSEIEVALSEMRNKALKSDLDSHIASTKIAIEELGKELLSKAYVKDICSLLDTKASIEDVNSALVEIHKELDVKVSAQTHTMHLTEQQALNSVFCSENTIARWIWRNGELANGFAVPWEIQSINTAPDNYIWEPDVTNIIVISPGLYEITFGFYCKKKPTVQLLVNGETILSAVNNASYVIHHSSGRLKNSSANSSTIAGLTLIDFIALPPRAKISISYNGDRNCEGFLSLKKL